MIDFTIPDFLRAIGKGPEERPEWWSTKCPSCGSPELLWSGADKSDMWCHECHWEGLPDHNQKTVFDACPFYDIITDWTPEKDALLLGAGLEWWRGQGDNQYKLDDEIHNYFDSAGWEAILIWDCDRPGLTLARAIWAALKGGGQ
jgi:hypothetical protein